MTRTNYIFIDFENVHETDWDRLVGKPAKVTLVLGEQHKSLPVAVVKKMLRCPGQVELIETRRTGRDAADMVLTLHIGEQNKVDPHGYFHIVSGDKGFDATIEHLREHGILAARRASLSAIPALMNAAERVQYIARFFREHPLNRPGSRNALESQIQTSFGKALSLEDLAATVAGLVTAKVIKLSGDGGVGYQESNPPAAAASGTMPSKKAPNPPPPASAPPKSSATLKPPSNSSARSKMT